MTHLAPDQFDLYLDEMLDPAERSAAAAHLAACPACRAELAALRDMVAALEALPPERLPTDLTGPVLARIAPTAQPWPVGLAPVALAAQAIIALVLSAWLVPPLLAWLPPVGGPTLPPWLGGMPALSIPPELAGSAWTSIAPLTALGIGQWGLILVLAGAAWLVTNRLLLQGFVRARHRARVLSR